MTAVEKVDWFCPKCNSYVSSESVTFEETHQICNTGVIIEPLNQNQMEKTAVEFLASVLSQAGQITKDDFDSLVKQAKEMEEQAKVEFAKLHVSKALNAACNNLENEYRILTSYPLENIK